MARAASAMAATSAATATTRASVDPRSSWSGSRIRPSLSSLESKRDEPLDASLRAQSRTELHSARSTSARHLAGLLHSERPLGLTGQELPHELVVGVEQLARRAGLDDAALPQDRDEVRHAPRRHDVVRDHAVGAAVLL